MQDDFSQYEHEVTAILAMTAILKNLKIHKETRQRISAEIEKVRVSSGRPRSQYDAPTLTLAVDNTSD